MRRGDAALWAAILALALLLSGCGAGVPPEEQEDVTAVRTEEAAADGETRQPGTQAVSESQIVPEETEIPETEEDTAMHMQVQIGENVFTAALEDNAAAAALAEELAQGPLTVQLRDYAGFEKVGALGMRLPADDSRTTTQAGDIVLYQGDQVVLFYGSNNWSYTRLGRVENLDGWADALGSGDVTVTFSLET